MQVTFFDRIIVELLKKQTIFIDCHFKSYAPQNTNINYYGEIIMPIFITF